MLSSKPEVQSALAGARKVVVAVTAMSGVVNVLALTGSFYMLQVYDRVLTSHSVPTLVALSALVIGLYMFQGVLDVLRGQVLVRLASRADTLLAPLSHRASTRLPLMGLSTTQAMEPMRDVDSIRSFLASQGPIAIFDLPWIPLYIGFIFLLHPWLGALAVAGFLVLVAITIVAEWVSGELNRQAVEAGRVRLAVATANTRNAEVVRAMGLGERAASRYHRSNSEYLSIQARASDLVSGLSGVSRVFRMMLQSAVLGLGAYLTLEGQVTAGAIIAASIAAMRAFAPVELAIGHWRGFVAARQAHERLKKTAESLPDDGKQIDLPPPRMKLTVNNITVLAPGTTATLIAGVSLQLSAGQAMGVIGPSGSGKSTLARALTGIWPVACGSVRLDGAALPHWRHEALGGHIGYLPQDVELFEGSIVENICRFEEDPDPGNVIAAAKAAGVHELVLKLPDGYDTAVGPSGVKLSAGQRQRIALARALYRDPFLVVLDEPNSNLDAEGEQALTEAIHQVRRRGGIVVVIAHRPSALEACDTVGVVMGGQLVSCRSKEEVLNQAIRPWVKGALPSGTEKRTAAGQA